MAVSLIVHPDATALALACAARLHSAAMKSLTQNGSATLALAGGRTAPPICMQLTHLRPDGAGLSVVPTDERWVSAQHADHNLSQLQANLAGCRGLRWLPLTPDPLSEQPNAATAVESLAQVPQPFSAVLLGMGPDGHFASLFPGAANLLHGLDPDGPDDALVIRPDPLPAAGPYARISLSLGRLLRTDCLLLAITGADKLALLQQAQQSDQVERWPVVALLRQQRTPVEVHWSP